MDLSNSMAVIQKQLWTWGEKLADTLKNITSDFLIGFGSFVDKPVMPFIITSVEDVCKAELGELDQKENCVPPYAFKHHLKLTKDAKKFVVNLFEFETLIWNFLNFASILQNEVKKANLSRNQDGPESKARE